MAGTISENGVGKSSEGNLSGEYLAEWRSSKQVENGITSTSPPFWDIDDEDDCGPKPSDLFGKYTWKIDKYSQIKKRELRSDTFETGSCKWYILIYPQGCDVCNHLSLFLCVANHDKLLPGWSHFAQFTITMVNKDLTKNKYSDTLHRFWKKEHDWGWKKFLESQVLEGFVDNDQLIIEAKVQVIREIPDRPFRCLSRIYRQELVPVYITNIEQVCSRFVEERRNKLVKLRDDKDRWSSFCAFWVAIDQNTRRHMCREKTDNILRVIVKQCFIEKEVTSTLVMDSLYSGLKALECQNKSKLASNKILNTEDRSFPIVYLENDMFVLVDDVLKLFGRVSIEPSPPKDDKGLHNRMKDGCVDGGSDGFIERCEKRLTVLGRRTIEIFVLAHIFSKIEVAYQEAISLKRQEELIREEEIWLAETEQRVKHYPSEKEKKSKKKKAKQRRKNHKGKTEKPSNIIEDDLQQVSSSDDKEELLAAVAEHLFDEINKSENTIDISDSVSCLPESPSPDSEERDGSWDTGASENIIPTDTSCNGVSGDSGIKKGNRENNNFNLVDDSSSTCSTDSVPSVLMDGLYGGYSFPKSRNRKSLNRIKNQQGTRNVDRVGYYDEAHNRQPVATHSKVASLSLYDRKIDEHHMVKKEKVVSLQRESGHKNQAIEDKSSKEKTKIAAPSLSTSSKITYSNIPVKPVSKISGPTNPPIIIKKLFSDSPTEAERATSVINTADSTSAIKLEFPNKPKLPAVSRPLSAPIIPGSKPFTPIVSHSMSTVGCLGPETSSYRPLSYKNVIMGTNSSDPPISSINPSQSHTQMPYSSISSFKPSQLHTQNSISQKSPLDPSLLHTEKPSSISASISSEPSISFKAINQNENNNYNSGLASTSQNRSQERTSQTGLGDDFPHLDIINNLLDEEQGFIMETLVAPHLPPHVSFPYDQDYYDDGYYGSLFAHFNSLDFGEMIPQINPGLYVNEPIDGLILSQWPMNGGDLSYYSGANMEVNNYPYNYMEYGNIACNVIDYTAFEPSNAH